VIELDGSKEDLRTTSSERLKVGDVRCTLVKPIAVAVLKEAKVRVEGMKAMSIVLGSCQDWTAVNDQSDLQVRFVLELLGGETAEAESRQRRMRIQRKQMELDMMRNIPTEELMIWEEKRNCKYASVIQTAWRRSSKYTKKKSEIPQNTSGHHIPLHRDLDTFELSPEDDDEDERNSMPRFHQIDEELTRAAKAQLAQVGWQSTHEHYENLIRQTSCAISQWNEWSRSDRSIARGKRHRSQIHRIDKLNYRLSNMKNKSLDDFVKSVEDVESDIEKNTRSVLTVTSNDVLLDQANRAHTEALGRTGLNWWTVRVGDEERDIRSMKMEEAWVCDANGRLKSNDDDSYSRWWVAFVDKDHTTDAVVLQERHVDQMFQEDRIRSDTMNLVREIEARAKRNEPPLLSRTLNCPVHRLRSLKLSENVPEESIAQVEVVSLKKKKKKSKKRDAAMKDHIDTLEEQVAILKAQLAKTELEKMKENLSI